MPKSSQSLSGSRGRGDVEQAIFDELQQLGGPSAGLAAVALQLAREMDGGNSATSKSMCAKALMEAMDRVRALAPPVEEADKVDELSNRRTARRAASQS